MTTPNSFLYQVRRAAGVVALAALSVPLMVQAAGVKATGAAPYGDQLAECLSAGNQSRRDCMIEAQAAQRALRGGQLQTSDAQALQANALARCERVPAESLATCQRMARGEGQRDGSVAEGAIIKRLVEVVPAPVNNRP